MCFANNKYKKKNNGLCLKRTYNNIKNFIVYMQSYNKNNINYVF